MISVGDPFLIRSPRNNTTHIYFVIASNQNILLLVNATTYRKGIDSSCILMPGDHDFIIKKSVINYEDAIMPSILDIQNALNSNLISRRPPPISEKVLKKIISGALASDALAKKHLKFLKDHVSKS